jgi:tetratricopeptide (TPR) repeat protein
MDSSSSSHPQNKEATMTAIELFSPRNRKLAKAGTPLRVVGIDLGTTNSTVAEAVWDPAKPEPVRVRCLEVDQATAEGLYRHVLLPSVVAIHDGRVLVGEGAKRLRARAPQLGLEQNRDLFYDCKNDIGAKRTYHRAPAGYRSASEIAGMVLAALRDAAQLDGAAPPARTVVTVPASFQLAQRRDTRSAAESAAIEIGGGALLDEPVAAFLDWVFRHPDEALSRNGDPVNLLVFDFGGGTCDVAVLRLQPAAAPGRIDIAPLAVSRYHRLGGGDIDAAIVHEILIPELCRQNHLGEFELGYEEKKKALEPSLLSVAESLKIALCAEIARLEAFGRRGAADRAKAEVRSPLTHECAVGGRLLELRNPSLPTWRFEEILRPLLDTDLLFARDTEYRMTNSIFSPITDALDRAGLAPKEIHVCLAVGGSCLIPQVQAALRGHFPKARLLTYDDPDAIQTAVARGAALHALALALTGRGLVRPISHDVVSLRTARGVVALVPKGIELPFPGADSAKRVAGLTVPQTVSDGRGLDLRVEVVAGSGGEERVLDHRIWRLPSPISKGEELLLEVQLDENQVLDVQLALAADPENRRFDLQIENPLTNVVNPQPARVKLDELEERLRTNAVPAHDVPAAISAVAGLLREVGHREKAFALLKLQLARMNRPDYATLSKMASLAGEMGDKDREEKLTREATNAEPGWGGSWFNLALNLRHRRKLEEAEQAADKAISLSREAPFLVLRSMIAGDRGDHRARERFLQQGIAEFGAVENLDQWELGWLATAAELAGDGRLTEKVRAERQRRANRTTTTVAPGGVLPDYLPRGIVVQ